MMKEKQRKELKKATHIPIEIVTEIIDRLPLKTLARFKCVSKLWSSLIHPIIDQRLLEEIDQRTRKYCEAKQSIDAISAESRVSVGVDELRARRVRLIAKVEEMLSFVDFDGDFGLCLNSIPRIRDSLCKIRDCLDNLDRGHFSRRIDDLIYLAELLQEADADDLN